MSDPYEVVALELSSRMFVNDIEYGNMAIITLIGDSYIEQTKMVEWFAESMDRQYLEKCGQVLPNRTWACRPLRAIDLAVRP